MTVKELIDAAMFPDCEPGQVSDGYHTFDELYEHRHALFIALMDSNRQHAWKSRKHGDGSDSYEGWFVAGLFTKSGMQITYHLPDRLWDQCEVTALPQAPEWDGHTSDDVVARLKVIGWSYR